MDVDLIIEAELQGGPSVEFAKVKKNFHVVGIKNSGRFADFGREVPHSARQFMSRANEIDHRTETEIALYEPKRDDNHLEGEYYVGLIVKDALSEVPEGMEYMLASNDYATARGKISEVGSLHAKLAEWTVDKGYQRNLDSLIIETYHPMESDEEEVEIYLPVL